MSKFCVCFDLDPGPFVAAPTYSMSDALPSHSSTMKINPLIFLKYSGYCHAE